MLRQFRYHRFCSDFVFDLIKLVAIRGDFRLYVLPAPCKRTGDTDMDLLMSLVSKGYSESQLLLSLWDCRLPYSTAEREKIGDQLIESVMFISRKKFVSIWAKTMLHDIQPPRHFSGHLQNVLSRHPASLQKEAVYHAQKRIGILAKPDAAILYDMRVILFLTAMFTIIIYS